MSNPEITPTSASALVRPSRRGFLAGTSRTVLSATAIALLAGADSLAAEKPMGKMNPEADVGILNVALGLEWEAIMAYQIGAESKLLAKPLLDVAVLFQSHHKQHAEALAATVKKLGGTPVASKTKADYAKALNAASIKSDMDVLRLAAKLEKGAANAYLGVIPAFSDPGLSQVAGRLAADETMHWTALAAAIGEPLPKGGLTFGA
jgi:rubrerythrin